MTMSFDFCFAFFGIKILPVQSNRKKSTSRIARNVFFSFIKKNKFFYKEKSLCVINLFFWEQNMKDFSLIQYYKRASV